MHMSTHVLSTQHTNLPGSKERTLGTALLRPFGSLSDRWVAVATAFYPCTHELHRLSHIRSGLQCMGAHNYMCYGYMYVCSCKSRAYHFLCMCRSKPYVGTCFTVLMMSIIYRYLHGILYHSFPM